jgi:hypothetical protein
MSHRGVEITLGQLATDEALRRRFLADPARTLGELTRVGIELSSIEVAALASLEPAALQRFALALDSRLQRVATQARPGSDQTAPVTPVRDQERRTP